MSFEPPDSTLDDGDLDDGRKDGQSIDYDEEVDLAALEGAGRTSYGPLVIGIIGAVVTVGFFVGPSLYRLAFGNAVGEGCVSGGECRSGRCLQPSVGSGPMRDMFAGVSGAGVCTEECSGASECGSDLRCFRGNCVPEPTAEIGDRCDAPWECRSGRCMVKRKTTAPLGGPRLPGPSDYEDTGTCKSQEAIEEMRQNIRRIKKAREKMRQLQKKFDR